MQSKEIVKQSYIAELNALEEQAELHAGNSIHEQLLAYNLIRRHGLLLPDNWREIQSELKWDEKQIQMSLSFARKHPELVESVALAARMMAEVCMTTGYLPFADGHGPQQLHSPNFFSVISKHLVSFRSEWKKHISRSPIEAWDKPSLEQFVYQLEPALDEINAIYASAKARLFAGPS